MIIGVAALVAAFAITDGVEVWSRDMLARESSVQDVAVTPVTKEVVNGRTKAVHGYPVFEMEDADRAGAEVPGVMKYALTLNGSAPIEFLDRRASAQLTLSTAGLADFGGMQVGFGPTSPTPKLRVARRLLCSDTDSRASSPIHEMHCGSLDARSDSAESSAK